MKVRFRCPPELKGILPEPYPAKRGLPSWLKEMAAAAFCPDTGLLCINGVHEFLDIEIQAAEPEPQQRVARIFRQGSLENSFGLAGSPFGGALCRAGQRGLPGLPGVRAHF